MNHTTLRRTLSIHTLFLTIIMCSSLAFAQGSQVDLAFNAVPTGALATDVTFRHVIQPDGKILVYNAPSMYVNGEVRSGMFRLNADGSTDTTFAYNDEGGVGINNLMVAPDGKIVLAGTASPNHAKMVRLNPNGSLDNSFSVFITASGPPEFTGNNLTVNAIQADGKVIATHTSWGNIQGTYYSYSMRRYNTDATIDSSFTSPALDGGHLVSTSALIAMLPDGRFYLGVSSGNHLGGALTITRRSANGTQDATFAQFSSSYPGGSFRSIKDLSVASDGGLLAAGIFGSAGNGFPGVQQMRRFLPDGSLAPGFASPLVYDGTGIHGLPDGKILYSATGWNAARPLMRLNSDGSIDNSYVLDPSITAIKNVWQTDSMDRPIFLATTGAGGRFVRLTDNGSIDPSFTPSFGAPGSVNAAVVQPDGKVIVSGGFTFMNGSPRNRMARLNADGSVDPTFDPGTALSTNATFLALQTDGKILVAGGSPVSSLIRLNSDGSRDESFAPDINSSVFAIALQGDGKILIAGQFTTVGGVSRPALARLTSAGALDTDFNAGLADPTNLYLQHAFIQPDGKVMIAGRFSSVNGTARANVARLEANGNLDSSFDAGTLAVTRTIIRQSDGRYVLDNGNAILRRNSDGTPDASFNAPSITYNGGSGQINSLLQLPDGTILVGGRFNSAGGFSFMHLMRLRWNGAADGTFGLVANNVVGSVVSYPAGKVVIAGAFTTAGPVTRVAIARLNITPLIRVTPFDFDGDGRADISVFRSSIGRWYEALSSGPTIEEPFGVSTDIPAPADYDGDGKTDEAIFRASDGQTWYKSSINGAQIAIPYGQSGDIARPSDFDGDGKADVVLFRPSNSTWYRWGSQAGLVQEKVFGLPGDQPLVGDFDGDGKSDLAIFRPSNGDWWYSASSANGAFRTVHWGQNGDIPVPADFDGDGKTDNAIFRPSDGGWYIYNSSNGSFTILQFGTSGDRPVAADYDGDGRADVAVFRPSTGIWYLNRSTAGFAGYQFGINTDTAVPGSLIP